MRSWSFNPKSKYEDIGSIDHVSKLYNMVESLLNDEELLLRYLTCGEIYTGNDNSDSGETFTDDEGREHNLCDIAYYEPDPDNYDYFYKDN